MDGVMNMIREFSEDFEEMRNSWKYVVKDYADGIEIEYWDTRKDEWGKRDSINISACCAELLFRTIAKDFENGNIKFD